MIYLTVVLLGFGLAMDAFAVCMGYGVCQKKIIFKSAFRLALSTALFQMIMPLLGWISGNFLGRVVESVAPFISFGLLLVIGVKMIVESFKKEEDCDVTDISRGKALFIICFATSIDAFAAGISIGLIRIPLYFSIIVIGSITFGLSLLGVYLGRIAGAVFERWAEILGGIILIGIGIKILLTNLLFG